MVDIFLIIKKIGLNFKVFFLLIILNLYFLKKIIGLKFIFCILVKLFFD